MSTTRILLTGATGYVGGSVLAALLDTKLDVVKNATISVLVRGKDQARALEAKGLRTVSFEGFDDSEAIQQAASEHDVVIHTASGFHTQCAKSLILGLAARKARTGGEVYYLHTSGTSNLADSPLLQIYLDPPSGVFSDQDPARTLSTLKYLNGVMPYPQRTTDLQVVQTGLETGVKTHIFICPVLYGEGGGDFHKLTHQIPALMRSAVKEGHAWVVGDGAGIKNHVHIMDLATLYETFLASLLKGVDVPYGERGIFFAENGEHSWKEVGDGIAKAGVELGILPTDEVHSASLEEATARLDWHSDVWTESGFVSTSRTSADVARSLGWKPRRPSDDFKTHYVQEWKTVLREDGNAAGSFKIW